MKLFEQKVANGVDAKADLIDGKVVIVVTADSAVAIDELKKLIPGTIDDAVLEVLKTALKSI